MKPIPTWRESMLCTDPQHPNIAAIKQHAIAQEIGALRQRVRELDKALTLSGKVSRKLAEEVFALEADAKRYRAIRSGLEVDTDNSGIVVSLIDDFGGSTLRDKDADDAIDAAMQAIGGHPV